MKLIMKSIFLVLTIYGIQLVSQMKALPWNMNKEVVKRETLFCNLWESCNNASDCKCATAHFPLYCSDAPPDYAIADKICLENVVEPA